LVFGLINRCGFARGKHFGRMHTEVPTTVCAPSATDGRALARRVAKRSFRTRTVGSAVQIVVHSAAAPDQAAAKKLSQSGAENPSDERGRGIHRRQTRHLALQKSVNYLPRTCSCCRTVEFRRTETAQVVMRSKKSGTTAKNYGRKSVDDSWTPSAGVENAGR